VTASDGMEGTHRFLPAVRAQRRDHPSAGSRFSAAFIEPGMPELVDGKGVVRSGKGKGMLVGMTLTRLTRRDHELC
jgi:hypothetical protein